MHIPDGMLSNATVAATGATSVGFVGYAVAWVRKHLDQQRVVLMAVMAALIFALQMLNFPVAGGTSGHFAGGAAAGILLGPWPAVIVMTTVLFVQALVFADGGVLALGANVLNMAVIGPFVGFAVWKAIVSLGRGRVTKVVAAFIAAWVAAVASALAAGVEIWASGNANFTAVMSAMGIWHSLIGLGEGAITAGLVAYVLKVRPDLVGGDDRRMTQLSIRPLAIGLALLSVCGVALSWLASTHPDGLEFVYFEQGVGARFKEVTLLKGLAPDYVLPGIANDTLAGVLAGLVGIVVVGALLFAAGSAARQSRKGPPANGGR
ncbi:MAG: energy-coupling factor ABC transporter permease [Coriobacteriales bacterium]|nr:energy-coupling factor ABC transporter permease [Coriobacteriales bacterium]